MKKLNNSAYSAGLTGCGFMLSEMIAILPILMQLNAEDLLRQEVYRNEYLSMRSEATRSRAIAEFKRRYAAMPKSFWEDFLLMTPEEQRIAMFFVILKTYRIAFDCQTNVVLKRWISANQYAYKSDFVNLMNDHSIVDDFVLSWTDATKGKVASTLITILRQVGLMSADSGQLHSIYLPDTSWAYYYKIGEPWFLDACLLEPYEVERIKQSALL